MRRFAALSVAALAAACGGSGGGSKGPVVGENPLCDPVAQSGCSPGWKCSWIQSGASTGSAGCVPAGAKAAGQACTWGAAGATTGFDDCAAGLLCAQGACTALCSTATDAGCSSRETCSAYSGLFQASPTAQVAYGGCSPQCNPLTQVRLTDGAPACGSPDPAAPTLGCYGAPSQDATATVFTCAHVTSLTNTQGAPAGSAGQVYVNSCAPGYLPLLVDSTGSTQAICIALCSPADTYLGSSANRQGVSPYSCPDKGATQTTQECRYWWWIEGAATPQTAVTSTLGFCFDYSRYTYGTPPAPTPSCATLSTSDTNGDGTPDYLEWGCGPR